MESSGSRNHKVNKVKQKLEDTSLMHEVKVTPSEITFESPRQSDNWCEYLKSLNWEIVETKSGIRVAFFKSFIGQLTKIQRPKNFNAKDLAEIEDLCIKRKAAFIKLEPGYGQNTEILEKSGFVYSEFPLSPPATLIIDLKKSEEQLWNDLSESGKYQVRRAQREGNKVFYFQNPSEEKLKEFYAISKETGEHGKFYVQPFSDLLTKAKVFADKAYILEVRNKEEKLVSAKLYLGYKNMVTYIQGGTSLEGRKEKGGYELMWRSFLYFKDLGYELIDLEGVDDPRFPFFTKSWGGFSHFKEKFGGIRIDFPRPYIKFLNPGLQWMSKFAKLPL